MNREYHLEGKTVWVAGHNGLVGSALVRRLQSEHCEILTAPREKLDLTNQAQTLSWLQDHKPDAIIMSAARVGGILANRDEPAPFFYENMMIAANVIHGAYLAGTEKLLFLGSSCIYPKEAPQPIREDCLLTAPLEPTNEAYALAKISALKMAAYYRAQYGCDFISAMPCNLYGRSDYYDAQRSHVIPALIMKFDAAKKQGKPRVVLWGSGQALREFLYVDDAADGLVYLLKNYSDAAPVNLGSGQEISIADLAQNIARVVGYRGEIVFDPSYPDGTMRKLLDNSKITKLGWQPQTTLNDGLVAAYSDYTQLHFKQAS